MPGRGCGKISVHGQDFNGTVVNDNGQLRYEVVLPHGTLHEGKNAVVATLLSHDAAGNQAVAVEHRTVTLDTGRTAPWLLIRLLTTTTLTTELDTPMQLISGKVGGDAQPGDAVIVEINHQTFNGKVIDLGGGHLLSSPR